MMVNDLSISGGFFVVFDALGIAAILYLVVAVILMVRRDVREQEAHESARRQSMQGISGKWP